MGKLNKGQRLGRGLGALLPSEDIQSASDTNADNQGTGSHSAYYS